MRHSELNAVAPSQKEVSQMCPSYPIMHAVFPTMPWGSVHLSVNMVSLKYDLISCMYFQMRDITSLVLYLV